MAAHTPNKNDTKNNPDAGKQASKDADRKGQQGKNGGAENQDRNASNRQDSTGRNTQDDSQKRPGMGSSEDRSGGNNKRPGATGVDAKGAGQQSSTIDGADVDDEGDDTNMDTAKDADRTKHANQSKTGKHNA